MAKKIPPSNLLFVFILLKENIIITFKSYFRNTLIKYSYVNYKYIEMFYDVIKGPMQQHKHCELY